MTATDLLPARRAPAEIAVRGMVIVRYGQPGNLWPRLWGVTYKAYSHDGAVLATAAGYWRLRAVLKTEFGPAFPVPMRVIEIGERPSWLWPKTSTR